MRGDAFAKANTCRNFIAPHPGKTSRGVTPHFIGEPRGFTPCRTVAGGEVFQGKQGHADPNDPTAAIRNQQAKAVRLQGEIENPVSGVQT